MIKPRWRFVNQANSQEQIIIHDEASASVLIQILGKVPQSKWVMQQEISADDSASIPQVSMMAPQLDPILPEPILQPASVSQPMPRAPQTPVAPTAPVMKAGLQPPPMRGKAATKTPVEKPAVEKPAAEKTGRERRRQERFSTEFRVILIAGNSCFRTVSVDVSLGGMKLKKQIPELFLNQSCLAYISHEDMRENIEMVCNIVGDSSDPCRIQFLNAEPSQLKRFEEWIQKRNHAKQVA